MTQSKLRLRPTVPTIKDGMARLKRAGDAVIVERGRPRHLLLCCPCGCGEVYPVNLDSRMGPAWRLRKNPGTSSITLFPSVWRESGCASHFIIWRNNILMFDGKAPSGPLVASRQEQEVLGRRIVRFLNGRDFVSPAELADEIDADPWDVTSTCRSLETRGQLLEGRGANKGRYRLQ